jgi:hypothetical protein
MRVDHGGRGRAISPLGLPGGRETGDAALWRRPPRPDPERPAPIRDGWPIVATIAAVVLGVAALIALRERIVRIVPPMAHAFRLLGAPVNLAGLELRGVHARIEMEGDRKVLVTEGEIVNIRRSANRPPPIALAVRGANGLDRYAWTLPAPKARLEPAEKIAFIARLAAPPEDGTEVAVRFAGAEEVPGKRR